MALGQVLRNAISPAGELLAHTAPVVKPVATQGLGATVKNVFNRRMPQANLPALQPKPILSFPKRPAVRPVAPEITPEIPDVHPDIAAARAQRFNDYNATQDEWMQSGVKPEAVQHQLEQRMGQLSREINHEPLQVRDDPTASARKALNAAFLRNQQRNGNPVPRVQVPKEPIRPAGTPVSPEDLESLPGPVIPETTGRFDRSAITQPVQRPPSQQLWRYLTAKPGTKAYDYASPASNLLQMMSRPVLTDPNLRRPEGWLRPAFLGTAGGLGAGAIADALRNRQQ